jgi:hypothetical protein
LVQATQADILVAIRDNTTLFDTNDQRCRITARRSYDQWRLECGKVMSLGSHQPGACFESMKIEVDRAQIRYINKDGKLNIQGDKLVRIVIAGSDGNFVPAEARIEGGEVFVRSPAVSTPMHVRYGWVDWVVATLVKWSESARLAVAHGWSTDPRTRQEMTPSCQHESAFFLSIVRDRRRLVPPVAVFPSGGFASAEASGGGKGRGGNVREGHPSFPQQELPLMP